MNQLKLKEYFFLQSYAISTNMLTSPQTSFKLIMDKTVESRVPGILTLGSGQCSTLIAIFPPPVICQGQVLSRAT